MTSPLTRLPALLLALALGAAACSSSEDDAQVSAGTTGDASASQDSGSVLDISAPAADGSTIDLSEFAGQDLMLWFWAPW